MKKKPQSRSPIQEGLLRNPAESLDKQIDKLVNDDIAGYLLVSALLMLVIMQEWFKYLFNLPPIPIPLTILGVIVLPFFIFRIVQIRKRLRIVALGRDGEKAVGQGLELLREQGAKVFHDVPAIGFNLDHVIVSTTGIFVVETKTYSKPLGGNGHLFFDGTHITAANGFRTDKPIIQATAAAHWLRERIRETTGKQFPVKPVVVFPGWFVEAKPEAKSSDVWVLNPKALATFVPNHRESISKEDVSLIAFHLSTYIKNFGSGLKTA